MLTFIIIPVELNLAFIKIKTMKKAFLIISFGIAVINAYSQTKFIKHYGPLSGEGNSLILNSNNDYIIAGRRNDDFCMYRLNNSGDTLWTKHYGGSYSDYASQLIQTADGGYVSIGSSEYTAINYSNIYFVKTTNSGAVSWVKQIGGQTEENATSLVQLATGDYMIGGRTKYNSHGLFDLYVLKTNSNGDTLWTKKIGGAQNEEISAMKKTTDGNIIISGYTASYTHGSKDCYLLKINPNGDTLWTKHYGGNLEDASAAVRQTSDGGYIIAGYSMSFGVSNQNMYVIKTNSAGDTLWTKTYGQPGRFSVAGDIVQTSDGGYAIAGTIRNTRVGGGQDAYLVKIDASGMVQWEREYETEPSHTTYSSAEGRSLIQTADGGFAIAGAWFNGSVYELLFIKTDGNGVVGIKEQQADEAYAVFPNPLTQSASLHFENLQNETYTLSLFNSEGRLVQNMTNITSGAIEIQRNNLPCGLYFFQLQSEKGMRTTGKLMIE
jgi:hypothetical protein